MINKIEVLAWVLTTALVSHPCEADSAIANAIQYLCAYGHCDMMAVLQEYEDLAAGGNQNAGKTLLLLQGQAL